MSRGACGCCGGEGQEEEGHELCYRLLVEDKIMAIASLEKFLWERIKVGGNSGSLGDSITVTREKSKITVTADSTFSKR